MTENQELVNLLNEIKSIQMDYNIFLTYSDIVQVMRLQEERTRNKKLENIEKCLEEINASLDSIHVPEEINIPGEITIDNGITNAIYTVTTAVEKLKKEDY